MVVRNPYAFLIKYFRLIHLFITAIFSYVLIKNNEIYKYLREVIKDSVNRYNASGYIHYGIYIWIALSIVLCFVIYYLLKHKDKPRKIYIFTIVGYIIVGTYMSILFTYMNGFSSAVIDQKTIRLYTDIQLISLIFQYLIVGIMLIRGLGFDIKKFNFSKDIQELNITMEDSEEIEVDANFDTTNVMRLLRRTIRELAYFYKEFKVYILIILIALIAFMSYRFYNFFNESLKVYNQNEFVGSVNRLSVKNSYYLTKNDKKYVIISFDIQKFGRKEQLNINNLQLNINNKKYLPNKNICGNFSKYGLCYKKHYITNEAKNYIAVYEIDDKVKNNNYLMYNEFYNSSYKIKLNIEAK